MTHAAKTPRLKGDWKATRTQDERASRGAVLAAVLKVSLAAVLAAVLAVVLTAALGAACSAVLPAPRAHASEASVDVTLLPIEDGAEMGAPAGGGTADESSSGDGGQATAAPRTASLAQTGDLALRCVLPLILAALAGAIVLALGRCLPRARRERTLPRAPGALDTARSGLALLLAAALAASCLAVAPRALADEDAASSAPDQEAPVGASTASSRVTTYWGDTEIEVSGDPIAGTTLTAKITVDPTYPADIQENLDLVWVSWNNDLPWLSYTDTVVIPEEALGYRLDLCITDTTGYILSTWVHNCGIVGRTLTGSASIEGEMAVISELTLVPNLPADAKPKVTWYAGTEPDVHGEKLGTGMTYTLPTTTQGLYISATVVDTSEHYYGTINVFGEVPVHSNAPPPTFVSAAIRATGWAWATVELDEEAVGRVKTIVVERKDGDAWTGLARKNPTSSASSVGISLDLADQLADVGSATVRAYTIGTRGTSDPGEEYDIVAQVAASVPLTMTCEVAGDGTVAATPHKVTNTGDLDLDVVGVETKLDGAFADAGTWTCLAGSTALFVGPFGSAGELWYPRAISPGESTTLMRKATGLSFEGEELTAVPQRYGTISYVVAPDV